MIDNLIETINSSEINIGSSLLRLVVGLLLGVCIGIERQIRRHDAGLRTFSLISLGSAGAVIISIWIPQAYPDMLNGDPARIAAQILTGVGFLGAGAIVHSKGGVQGLTTAACIWQTAIIGMAAGAGLYIAAAAMTILTLFLLSTVERMEKALDIHGGNHILSVVLCTAAVDLQRLKNKIEETGIELKVLSVVSNIRDQKTVITYRFGQSSKTTHSQILATLAGEKDIVSVNIQA